MAMKITIQTADAMLGAIATLLNAGKLRIYSGTEPTDANTALGAQVLLAELTFPNPAFPNAIITSGNDRVMTTTTIVQDSGANADGTATFFRCFDSSGTTQADVVYQGTVGTSGQQLNMTATNIVTDGVVSISSLSISQPMA